MRNNEKTPPGEPDGAFDLDLRVVLLDSCLSCAEACDRHAEGRAGNIIKADIVAELDGSRVAAVLTADTAVELRVDGLAHSDGHLHELADAVLIRRINTAF